MLRGKLDPEDATKIAIVEFGGAILRIEFINTRGNVGSQILSVACQTERFNQNRFDIAKSIVWQWYNPWRAIRRIVDVSI